MKMPQTTKSKKTEKKIQRDYNITLKARNDLLKLVERYLGYDSLYVWNANINGNIIQLRTNDPHLDDFWKETWFPAAFDENMRSHGVIYAVTGIPDTKPGIYYHPESKTGIVINTNFYEKIRSLALGIVFNVSEKEEEIHFLRGSLVDINGEGVVFSGPLGSGNYTHTFLLLELDGARIHSDEWIYLERLGGKKGRISTHISERKFYIKKDVEKINPHLKEIFKRSKSDEEYVIVDPTWIGGKEKYVDTTRIKVLFLLNPDPNEPNISKRLNPEEALSLLENSPEPFFNPHILVMDEERKSLFREFFQELLEVVACYSLNTSKPIFDVQRRVKDIIKSREYTHPLTEKVVEIKKSEKSLESLVDMEKIKKAVLKLYERPNVRHPPPKEIKQEAVQYGTKTKFGNYNFVSTVKNRSAPLTVYIGSEKVTQSKLNPRQREIIKNLPKTMEEAIKYLKKAPFVCTERTMGDNPDFSPHCTLYVSTHRNEMIRLAHMVNQTLFEPSTKKTNAPDEYLVYIPEWQEKDRQILVFPEIGVTFVLGTDYYGEAKKGFLRMAMWNAKQQGMLGLHTGSKILKARDAKTKKIKRYSMLILGLTATGKTTHSCHNHGLTEKGEGIGIAQDDVAFLRKDCSVLGTERGFYLKTEGVTAEIQPLIYNAVTKSNAIFENVVVDYKGNVYFGDETLTGNARGVMQWSEFGESRSESIDLPPLSELDGMIIAFITRRNTVVPIASKLTLEQGAAAFMLGESIESTGSDPRRVGESVREVGTNPFIIGDYTEEGNLFYEFLKGCPKVQCYLLNTGGVGEIMDKDEEGNKIIRQKVLRVEIPEMAAIIRGIARNSIEWKKEPYFETMVPEKVEGVDMSKFDLSKYYTQEEIVRYVEELKEERA
ncbi:MAG: phosphoenolpyruvate carboxykinase, partial [Candidatus Hydrothermarchaeales archaeon]